eukprot:g24486.t1
MWMRYHGIGERTMSRALSLYKKNNSVYLEARPLSGRVTQDDWIYSYMFEYFTENVETIADGIWHLQKVDDFPAMFRWINAKWAMAIPGSVMQPVLHPLPRQCGV